MGSALDRDVPRRPDERDRHKKNDVPAVTLPAEKKLPGGFK